MQALFTLTRQALKNRSINGFSATDTAPHIKPRTGALACGSFTEQPAQCRLQPVHCSALLQQVLP